MRREAKPKPIFRGLTIAVAGDLGRKPGGSMQWTDANMLRWVTLREGKFVRRGPAAVGTPKLGEADGEGITHLVCSREEFRRGGGLVKAALKRKGCHIVSLDWLEDSMLKIKRLDEELYSHRRVLEQERKRERRRLMVVKGQEKAVKEVNPTLYHLYRDHTFFQYLVVMTRNNEEAGIQGERYVLSIYESDNDKPRVYWFVVRFYKKKGDPQPKIYRPSPAPGTFAREFALFESFFQIKTGIPWAQRLIKAGTTDRSVFQYQPPTGGKPVGWVPAQYTPADDPDVVMLDREAGTATAAQPAITAPDTNDNKAAGTMVTCTNAVTPNVQVNVPSHQQTPLITPAPSPRSDQHGTEILSSQDAAEKHAVPAQSSASPMTAPHSSCLPLRPKSPMVELTGAANTVCAV